MSLRSRRPRILALLAAFATAAAAGPAPVPAPAPASVEEGVMNPHLRESCLRCHKVDPKEPDPGHTKIFTSREEPHAAVASICRSCHKDAKPDFWILVLPSGDEKPSSGPAAPPLEATPASRPASVPPPQAGTAAAPPAGVEGFENSHDAMACAGCHEKTAEQLKPGAPPPPRLASQGADLFCRSCHSGVDRSHFPRGNLPAAIATCLSCHRAHGRALLFPALRDDFPAFLADSTALNPHGGKIFCLVCHPDTPQPGAPLELRFPGDSLRLCQRCHSGVEHHPLKVKSAQETWKMDFSHTPLENEGVICISCHKPLECRGATGRENPRFLRGGPYNSGQEFCQRCHEDNKLSSLNPHDQIDETGEVYRKKCLYCHVSVPNTGEGNEGLRFTDVLTGLCTSCHQVSPHPSQTHVGRLPQPMQKKLHTYEEQRQVRLPLENGTEVTCVTCHNPHERGLLKGSAGIGADEFKRLRMPNMSEQCSPCHERY